MITVTFNDKPVYTPLGQIIAVPTAALAKKIAQECGGKEKPLTHLTSVAIDLVARQRAQVIEDITPYIHTDVVCYRADNNPPLHAREQELLNPIVVWANGHFGVELIITHGVMPVNQLENMTLKISQAVDKYSTWQLAALAVATKLLGSILLASALVEEVVSDEEAFACATIEDDFETQSWGKDDEKEARLGQLKRDLMGVKEFLNLLQ